MTTTATTVSRFYNSLISSSESESEELVESSLFGTVKKSKFMYSDSDENDSEEEDSDYSDEDDSEEDSDASGSEAEASQNEGPAPARRSRFLLVSDSEEDEEGSGKVMKSHKEKAWDEIIATISLINDSISNEDWNGANISFDRLTKQATKAVRHGLPSEYFVFLNQLDTEHMAKMTPAEVKKLDKENAKACNALRQKSRKLATSHADDIKRTLNPEAAAEEAKKMKFGRVSMAAGADDSADETTSKVNNETTPKADSVIRKLQEVMASRGKKNFDRVESISTLKQLLPQASNDEQRIQILNAQVSFEFDLAASTTGYMLFSLWSSALENINKLSALLLLTASTEKASADDFDGFVGLPSNTVIRGSFLSYLYRIDDEFMKALQYIDPHSADFVEFVRQEGALAAVLLAGQKFLAAIGNVEAECHVLLRYLEHIYYKTAKAEGMDCKEVLGLLLQKAPERTKQKAVLCYCFHLAICGDYKTARELFAQHRFQEAMSSLEATTQIIYNRVMVAMGLCAFRLGYVKDAYFALQELCSSGRPKELLTQGVQSQKFAEKTPEQERTERQRQLPNHMHLNVELIDCVFLTCSMILEVPQSAYFSMKTSCQQDRKMYQSRHLKRLMDAMERNIFTGPAENTRDALILAARCLVKSDWDSALKLVSGLKVWESLIGSMQEFQSEVLPMLVDRIKEAALCTFIYSYATSFDALSMEYLADYFEMDRSSVAELVSKLISDIGIPASLDEKKEFLRWNVKVDVTKVQEMSMVLADKIQIVIDRNEETVDFLHRPQANKF